MNTTIWPNGYRLPQFDVEAMKALTRRQPIWLHFGAGNIFRAFPAVLQQELLEVGLADRGITVCECYDEEIIPACYTPHDNVSLLVTLKADGGVDKRVIASVAEAFNAADNGMTNHRLIEIFLSPSLQLVSFTITEKGYAVTDANGTALPFIARDAENGPDGAQSIIGCVTAGLLARCNAGGKKPLALLSLDNCAENGDKLARAVRYMAGSWLERGFVSPDFIAYINGGGITFPWSMIDKITPRPSETVADLLKVDGYTDGHIIETRKHTFVSSFVNAEACQYLVVEDDFPNGRPALEKAGAYLTSRETVKKTERMKVSACLNPLHTILAISGMLLRYTAISECMRDERLVRFINRAAYDESLPVAVHPGVIDPEQFLHEVITERLPNPFIPDTPARIACDTSQKISVRFGETIKARLEAGLPVDTLEAIPLFFAFWLRYLTGTNDNGELMALSPDPRLSELTTRLSVIRLGDAGPFDELLKPVLSDETLFGVNLYDHQIQLGDKVVRLFETLITGPGAIDKALNTHFTH